MTRPRAVNHVTSSSTLRRVFLPSYDRLRPRASARFAASLLLAGFAAGLVCFHSWLLWRRLANGPLLEPRVTVRWMAAALLVAALLWLRGRGIPLLWGRRALGLWTLVLLLHADAACPPEREGATGGGATLAVVVLPATATLVTLLLAFGLPAGGVGVGLRLRVAGLVVPLPARLVPAIALPTLAARPPPVAF